MSKFSILLVDDEESQRVPIRGFLEKRGFIVKDVGSVDSAVEYYKNNIVNLIITDLKMPDKSGADLLNEIKSINPNVPIIVITAFGEIDEAVSLLKSGASDFLQKPIDLMDLIKLIEKFQNHSNIEEDNKLLTKTLEEDSGNKVSFSSIVYKSDAMKSILSLASRVAISKASVLIRGESGTGKELIARAIHDSSDRKNKPFVTVNCAALPETLFESELFGHEKGAFTGAVKSRIGKFEQANEGTLFIDEVGDIPLPIQVKLLRALQFGEIQRLGGDSDIKTDVRIVSATNRNLEEMIQNKEFREDLVYRLNVVTIQLPPLRSRKQDIQPLLDFFVSKYSDLYGKKVSGITPNALDLLMKYDFPGNIRELENIIQRAIVISRGNFIDVDSLELSGSVENSINDDCITIGDLNEKVESLEIALINKALIMTNGNQVKAAALLNINERTLRYKISKYNIKH